VDAVRRYLDAVAGQDWGTVSDCLAADVRRVGPFGDVYEGHDRYLAFLRRTMPTLAGYRMDVERVLSLGDGRAAVAELSETVELDGRAVRTPESLVFDLDDEGRIRHIAIYIQQLGPDGRTSDSAHGPVP
jgi:ketosteroid isomerase-like protein